MKFTRIIALLICTLMIITLFSACGKSVKSPFVGGDASGAASGSETQAETLNLAGAYASVDPKTVMLTINGKNVAWEELFCYISSVINAIQSQGIQITDWSAVYQDGITYKDFVLDKAVNLALQNAAVEYGAQQLKVTLTDKNKADAQANWDTQVSSAGSEEAFLSQLKSSYLTKDLYTHLVNLKYLYNNCFTKLYGDKGSKLSDQDVAESIAEDGYIMVKHILMLTTKTDNAGQDVPIADNEKAAVYKKMQDILAKLKAYKGKDFDAYFDSQMKQYSQDPGIQQFPDGYLFQNGDMYSEFYDGAVALDIGKISDIIETEKGYHIIYRIPINYEVTPISIYKKYNYEYHSLREITASTRFEAIVNDDWLNSLDITYADTFKSLDFNKLFAQG